MAHRVERVTVDGATIRLFRGGSGPPLVFLHGAGGHTGWMAFLEELSRQFRGVRAGASRFRPVGRPALARRRRRPRLFPPRPAGGAGARPGAPGRHLARRLDGGGDGGAQYRAAGEPDPGRGGRHHRRRLRRSPISSACRRRRICGAITPTRNARRGGSAIWRKADFRVAAKNRATVTRLAYRPRFHNPGLAEMAAPDRRADPAVVGRRGPAGAAGLRRGLPRR